MLAGICLKLVQAFVTYFSAACHSAYNNLSPDASPPSTAVVPSTPPVSVSLRESPFPALFTPLAAYFMAEGSWIDLRGFPGHFCLAPAPRMPSQSTAAIVGTAAATATAQAPGLESTPGEAESATHLLLCLLNPVFLAAHLQLPLLLVAAAAAALVELLFLSHTLKNQPASEGVPLMNAALTLSMGLGGLTLLGAAPRNAVGWTLGLVLLVVGVGVLGFGGKTWLAVRRLVHSFQIRTRSVAYVEHLPGFGSCMSRVDESARTDSTGNNSKDYRLHCRSDAEENAAAAVAAGGTGPATLERVQDVSNMLRTPLQPAAGKDAAHAEVTSAVEAASVIAWSLKATCSSRNMDPVGEIGGTISAIAAGSRNSGQCTAEQEVWRSGPAGVSLHVCKVVGTTDGEPGSGGQELRSPLLMHPA